MMTKSAELHRSPQTRPWQNSNDLSSGKGATHCHSFSPSAAQNWDTGPYQTEAALRGLERVSERVELAMTMEVYSKEIRRSVLSGRTVERGKKWKKGWVGEWMNEWMNEWRERQKRTFGSSSPSYPLRLILGEGLGMLSCCILASSLRPLVRVATLRGPPVVSIAIPCRAAIPRQSI